MSEDNKHPMLVQFQRELKNRDLNKRKVDDFNAWRNGAKCTGEVKEQADALWAEYEKVGEQAFRKIAPAAPAPRYGGPGQRQGGTSGHRPGPGPRDARGHGQPEGGRGPGGRGVPQAPQREALAAAEPSCLGSPFHNPYTFLAFAPQPPRRGKPTPLTIDELPTERDRLTGVLELTIKTLRPLMSCESKPSVETNGGHREFRALTTGRDVIVPATGIRGSLRTLMTVLTGGTLGYIDEEVWLCQGRDLNLGPASQMRPDAPREAFLARVEEPGNAQHPGTVRLGETRLVAAEDLGNPRDIDTLRPTPNRAPRPAYATQENGRWSVSDRPSGQSWELKLSGRPIQRRGKREGLFRPGDTVITLPAEIWGAYGGRNRHGDHPELKRGDLVWVEAADPQAKEIRSAGDVRSIQWARWGRRGERLIDVVRSRHPQVLPDSFRGDGLVDEVTDLWGQVPWVKGAAGPFAARVRPENLVFFDAADGSLERRVPLAPLAPPHPGCAAFYRDADDVDHVRNHDSGLRGYKIYRVAAEGERPWLFSDQGVYGKSGKLKPPQQRVNKTCDLLRAGADGRLRISVRSLTVREMALLLAACSVDWRLGGGKPLGLGLCRVTSASFIDEHGERTMLFERDGATVGALPAPYDGQVDATLRERLAAWQGLQTPVQGMRYPRAVDVNNNRIQRGGHAWFARHASMKKSQDGQPEGLQVLWTQGELRARVGSDKVRAQMLPRFDPGDSASDELYGYDCIGLVPGGAERRDQKRYERIEPFDPNVHATGNERSGGAQGQNRDTRSGGRNRR